MRGGALVVAAALAALVGGVTLSACSKEAASQVAESHLVVTVAPLDLPDLDDVVWTITIKNGADPAAIVTQRDVGSAAFGAADGSLSFVGVCDASANPNTVTLELAQLVANGQVVPATQYAAPPPITKEATCLPQGDTAVDFDVTVARASNQGFFDVAVEFDDIFCSAKLDCLKDGTDPLELLFHDGVRDTTVVVAWACTTGADTPTYLHMDAVVVECTDGSRMIMNPSAGPGNTGPAGPYLFERAVYVGEEQTQPYTKCYWNSALGIDLAAIPNDVSCTLSTRATASTVAWEIGNVPSGQVRPAITWEVPIVTNGALSCTQHAIDVPGSHVETHYIGQDGPERFGYSMVCEPTPRARPNGTLCAGTVTGFDDQVVFASTAEGLVVVIGDATSDPMPLPSGVTPQDACCLDPCCVEP